MLLIAGDLEQLLREQALSNDDDKLGFEKRRRPHALSASALITVNGDLSDLLMGHNTWYSYTFMNRIFKRFAFGLSDASVVSKAAAFPSYPGVLASFDSFYLLSSELAVMGTPIHVKPCPPPGHQAFNFLLDWQRVWVANELADSGRSWAEIIEHNQSPRASQFLVVDFKQFYPRKELCKGLLTVIEQSSSMDCYINQRFEDFLIKRLVRTGFCMYGGVPRCRVAGLLQSCYLLLFITILSLIIACSA